MTESTEQFTIDTEFDDDLHAFFLSSGLEANSVLTNFCSQNPHEFFFGETINNGTLTKEFTAMINTQYNPIVGFIIDVERNAIANAIEVITAQHLKLDILILIEIDSSAWNYSEDELLAQLIQTGSPSAVHRGKSMPTDALLSLYADQLNHSFVCVDFADIYAAFWGAEQYYFVETGLPDGRPGNEVAYALFEQLCNLGVSTKQITGATLSLNGNFERLALGIDGFDEYSSAVCKKLPDDATYVTRTSGVPPSVTEDATAMLWVGVTSI